MNGLRVELRRFFSRRLVLILIIVAVGGVALSSTIAFFQSHQPTEFELRRLERREVYQERCLSGETKAPPFVEKTGGPALEEFCQYSGPYVEDPRFLYSDMDEVLLFTCPIWVMLALVAGASFIGAEWHTGNIATTLTWEPRRVRLYLAKAIAVTVAAFLLATMLQVLLALLLGAVAALRGSTAGLSGDFWRETGEIALRSSVLAVAGGLLGFSLASIGRNTGAALGILFAYSAIVETAVRGFKPQWFTWLLTDNAVLFMSGDPTLFGADVNRTTATFAIAAYALIPLVVGLVLFKRRDVT